MAIGVGIAQKQTTGMVPEHIIGKTVLRMGLQELQQFVQTQVAENPALTLEDYTECPACHSPLADGICPACGATHTQDPEQPREPDENDWRDDPWPAAANADDSLPEQFAGVAAPLSLTDHLKAQVRSEIGPEDRPLAEFIVDCLDEDGYLREPMIDIADRFHFSVPQAEAVLVRLQRLDPPGIAARDLRECLLIQLSRLEDDSADQHNAEVLLRDHWDSFSRMKIDEAARQMGLNAEEITSAMRFIRKTLNPYPAAMFHDPWQEFAPRHVPRVAPDLVVRQDDEGISIDVVDPVSGRIAIDEVYAGLHSDARAGRSVLSVADLAHIRESVSKAKALIEAVEYRKATLSKLAGEILQCQEAFFKDGPEALKPLTKKDLARRVGVHESTVCRATQEKTLRLPSGDTISFDVIFDSALPVKELVKRFAAERLNDGQIAKKLGELGVQVARRTVAKYRDQLRVLPIEYRKAA